MTPNGTKVFNKTALTLVAWMTAIVLVVAWRSEGNMLAICLASGLPLGVVALWSIVHLSDASRVTPQQVARIAKKTPSRKVSSAAPVARVSLQTLAQTSGTGTSAAARATAKPVQLRSSPQAHGGRRSVSLEDAVKESLAAAPAQAKSEKAAAFLPQQRAAFHPLDTIPTNAAHQMMEDAVKAGEFSSAGESSFNVNFLDHMQYLYTPSQVNARKTLDLGDLSKKPSKDSLSTLSDVDGKSIPQLDLDWTE